MKAEMDYEIRVVAKKKKKIRYLTETRNKSGRLISDLEQTIDSNPEMNSIFFTDILHQFFTKGIVK